MQRKRHLTIFIFLLIQFTPVFAQNPTLEWAIGIGSTGLDYTDALAVDDLGNIYTCGSFENTVDFDPGVGVTNLTSNGYRDVFIQKMDGNGNLIWVKSFGAFLHDFSRSIVLDSNGDVYITGIFYGTVDFDPGVGIMNLTSNGNSGDAFILKLTENGDFLWAKSMGAGTAGVGTEGLSIKIDLNGNVCTAGFFSGTADFDPGLGITNLVSNGGVDVFIQKLASSGSFLWAKSFGGVLGDFTDNMNIDANGNIFISGWFQQTVDFDPGAGVENRTSNGASDIYILKLDANGGFLWVETMGGALSDFGRSIATDASGNVYLSGHFNDTVDFDPGAGILNLTSNGNLDMFITKLDANGGLIWAKSIGGPFNDDGWSLTLDLLDNIVITGYFNDTVDFDPGPGTFNLTSAGEKDQFILKLDGAGNFIWVGTMGGTWVDSGYFITSDDNGYLYTTGYFASVVDFDPGPGIVNLSSSASTDLDGYIQKFADGNCQPTNGVDIQTACDSYTWIDGNTYSLSNTSATDTLVNASGCDSIVTLNLTINSVSNLGVNELDATLTADLAPSPGVTYNWLDCDNNFAPLGVITQSFSPVVNGNYAVQIGENECLDTSACFLIDDVGLDLNIVNWVSITPNPTNDLVTLSFEKASVHLTILDVNGRLIAEMTMKSGDTVDMSLFKSGVYLFSIVDDSMRVVRRVIKR